MKNNLHFITKRLFVFLMALGIFFNYSYGQKGQYIDDPNLDQIPTWYLDQISGATKAPSMVITINEYDNFYLGDDYAECHISANPLDPTQFFTAYNVDDTHNTTDGHDWDNATAIAWGTIVNGDPVTAYDGSGNLYYENMFGSVTGCKVVRSSDNGSSWGPSVTAISGVDKNWIAVDQSAPGANSPFAGYVYTVMTAGGGNGNFARSTDLGATWTTTFTPATQSVPGMMVCVGPNGAINGGAVYIVTNSGSSFASTYTFYRSLNGGATFSLRSVQNYAGYVGTKVGGRNSVENMRTRPYPFITADNSNGLNRGRLYLVYASNYPDGDGNKSSIWCRFSDNGGLNWSSKVRVNDDAGTQNNHQWHPAIWCDLNTGRLYVHWMDTRDTPTSDSAFIYATYSDFGGESFVTNQKISNEKMKINCTTCGSGGTPRYQGDYTSIVSNSNVSMSSWTDFRWGSFASFTAYFPDYAMRLSTPVKNPDGVYNVLAEVPDVKLYTDDVIFTASMETPPSGSFSISYPSGNTLSTFPGSIPIQITDNNVPSGIYTLSVVGKGPNGTPVHKREINISVVAPPVADFIASNTNPFVNTQVNFTDLSSNAPTSWSWSFNPSTINYLNGTHSSSENPQVEFLAPGLYSVTLVATNAYGSDPEIKVNYISATICTYCSTSFSNTADEWVSNVAINTINNSSGSTNYSDFTSISTDVNPGSSHTLSVDISSTGAWVEQCKAFFDWNQNCDFTEAGEVFDLGSTTGPGVLSTTVNVPAGASIGATLMRVSLRWSSDPTGCDVTDYGEAEDYTINIMPSDIMLNLTAMLEGPFNGTTMDANLGSLIPLSQPFNTSPWNYTGAEIVAAMPNGNIVGWVLVDLRVAASAAGAIAASSIGKQAAFILNDGSIVDLDGSSDLTFAVGVSQNLYVALWHRNHVGIMSNNALIPTANLYSYNYTTGINQVYGGSNGHKQLVSGIWGMFSGDGNADGSVGLLDKSSFWDNEAGNSGFNSSDYNLDGESNNIDKDQYWLPNIGEGSQVPN